MILYKNHITSGGEKQMRKKLNLFLVCCCLLLGNTAYAANLSMGTISQTSNANSLNVRVVEYVDGEEVVVYTGPVSQYNNGLCASIDFQANNFAVVFEWDDPDAEYYIFPIQNSDSNEEQTDDFQNIDMSDRVQSGKEHNMTSTITSADIDSEAISYDVIYNVTSDENLHIDATYTIHNVGDENGRVSIIAALYDNGRLCDINTKTLDAINRTTDNLTLTLPDEREQCYVKLMAWDDIEGIQPLGESKCVVDLDAYNREKYLYINEGNGSEFNLFMRQSMVKGDNNGAIHTIEYDSSKMEPIDLCGLTYNKEMSVGEIPNTGITIKNVDLNEGNIQYSFDMAEGRNIGVINYIKFRAVAELNNEPIIYTIQ